MTILDRLLGHDTWTTRQLLLRCRELSDEQLDRKFNIGDRSVRETFNHIIVNMEQWTDQMLGVPIRPDEGPGTVGRLLQRLDSISRQFTEFALKIEREGRADEMCDDPEDGIRRSLGGITAHIITHSMHHRAQVMYMLEQLGLEDVIEGDALGWEAQARGWRYGSYGKMAAE